MQNLKIFCTYFRTQCKVKHFFLHEYFRHFAYCPQIAPFCIQCEMATFNVPLFITCYTVFYLSWALPNMQIKSAFALVFSTLALFIALFCTPLECSNLHLSAILAIMILRKIKILYRLHVHYFFKKVVLNDN